MENKTIEKKVNGSSIKCDLCEELKVKLDNDNKIISGERFKFGKKKLKKNLCDECIIDIVETLNEDEEE